MNNNEIVKGRMQKIARKVDEELPQGYGFVVLAFTFGEGKDNELMYVSNANREDIVKAMQDMQEWIEKTKNTFGNDTRCKMNNIISFPSKKTIFHNDNENTVWCRECKTRPATRLCDYEDGLLFDAKAENGIKKPIQRSYCSKPLCDECTHKLNQKDYCTEHWNLIKKEAQRR